MKPYALPETAPKATGQLFNLDKDPGETRSLGGPALAEWRARMVKHLAPRGPRWVVDGKLVIRKKPIRLGKNYPR